MASSGTLRFANPPELWITGRTIFLVQIHAFVGSSPLIHCCLPNLGSQARGRSRIKEIVWISRQHYICTASKTRFITLLKSQVFWAAHVEPISEALVREIVAISRKALTPSSRLPVPLSRPPSHRCNPPRASMVFFFTVDTGTHVNSFE
jgi:hypothetical protein